MRTRILCLNGIGSPERVRYAYIKAQKIQGYLINFLNKVLSGTSDFSGLKGIGKDYFADFLIGKKTLPRKFISFYLDLISIEDLPLPSSSSLNDLFEIYQQDSNLIVLLKEYYASSEIIIGNESFWEIFYKKISTCSQENIINSFYVLSSLSSANQCNLWNNFPSDIILQKAFSSNKFNDLTKERLNQWMDFLKKFKDINSLGLSIFSNHSEIKPLHKKTEKLLSRLLPVLFSNDYADFDEIVWFFNSKHLSKHVDLEISVGLFHFIFNLFEENPSDLIKVINLFLETKRSFYWHILDENAYSRIEYFKHLFLKFFPVNNVSVEKNGIVPNAQLLNTLYIISKFRNMIAFRDTDILKRINIVSGDFHERLFIAHFVKYEVPWYFIKNLNFLTDNEFKILFNLLAGKNLQTLIKSEFPVSHKEVHIFMNVDRFSAKITDGFIHTGLFWAKIENFKFHSIIYNPLKQYFRYNLPVRQFIEHYNFWIEVLGFFKRNELLIQPAQISPLLDFLTAQRHLYFDGTEYHLRRISYNRIISEMEEWHLTLRRQTLTQPKNFVNSWKGIKVNDFVRKTDYVEFSIVQLKSDSELFDEGTEMKHCVYSYKELCISGRCSIWSFRQEKKGSSKRIATIELRDKTIVQVRKKANLLPGQSENTIINVWAKKEGLKQGYLF